MIKHLNMLRIMSCISWTGVSVEVGSLILSLPASCFISMLPTCQAQAVGLHHAGQFGFGKPIPCSHFCFFWICSIGDGDLPRLNRVCLVQDDFFIYTDKSNCKSEMFNHDGLYN